MRLEGKIAIVTGGGTGIGHAIALTFAREGASIVVADVDPEAAEQVASEVESMGRKALAVKVDVSDGADVDQLVQKTLDSFNTVDILVNNAGVVNLSPPEDEKVADWNKVIDVNLKGQFLCCQTVGRHMIKQRQGKIVNIASTSGHRGMSKQTAYCASKAGVMGLTRTLAVNWAKYNINVNSVSPGTTMTPMLMKAIEERGLTLDYYLQRTPLGRANRPEDIANAVLFLSSSEADNITGQDILVDGGMTVLYWPAGE
jgi:NAD(P)-dependent dehydrogenase (short-subunit alcohol dehydrogenase family)